MTERQEIDGLMTTADVAALFKVKGRTVTRWGTKRYLTVVKTLGGQNRYVIEEVYALLKQQRAQREESGKWS